MSVRRRKRNSRNRNNYKIYAKYLLLLIGIITSIFLLLFFCLSSIREQNWDGEQKITIAVDNADNGVLLYLIDPRHQELHKFVLPENLELETANNMGRWKLGSLWELGFDEKIGGRLLAYTISKSIHLPVNEWSGPKFVQIIEGGYLNVFRSSLLAEVDSSLSFIDKIRIVNTINNINDVNKIEYPTESLDFLSASQLKDGSEGYIVERYPSTKILSLFVNDYVTASTKTGIIIYSGESNWKAANFGEVLEVVGLKIAAVKQQTHEISDCEISSNDEKSAKIIADYFDCDYTTKVSSNFDVEIRIGDEFLDRF